MSSIPVPPLPPLSTIKDPAVRSYLQALDNGWKVRNGSLGDGQEKFLTLADLESGVTGARNGMLNAGSAGVTSPTNVDNGLAGIRGSIAGIMASLSNAIQQSYLWKRLTAKIDYIERPAWFKDRYGAEVKVTEQKIVDGDQALAGQLTQVVTAWNTNWSLAQQQITSVSTAQTAQASVITNLQADVGTAVGKAEQAFDISADVDGTIKGAWTVKFDAGGHAGGFGYGIDTSTDGQYVTDFTVIADRFSVWNSSNQKVSPFIISGGNTYIKSAMINTIAIGTGYAPLPGVGSYALTIDPIGILRVDNIVGERSAFYNIHYDANPVFAETFKSGKVALYGKSTRSDTYAFETWNSSTGKSFRTGGTYAAESLTGQGTWKCADGVIPFTGIHEAIMADSTSAEPGDIMVDVRNVRKQAISSTISEVEPSSSVNQPCAVGVFNSSMPFDTGTPSALWDGDVLWDGEDFSGMVAAQVNAIGDGQINVCGEGGAITAGDLIVTSSIAGKGMKQADDIVRSYTVAKARESVSFVGPCEVKLISCIYLCG